MGRDLPLRAEAYWSTAPLESVVLVQSPSPSDGRAGAISAPATSGGSHAEPVTASSRWRWLRRQPAANIVALFLVAQIVCVLGGLIFPDDFRYVSATNVSLVLKAIPVLGVIALGVGVLMISGEFDLSVGAVYTVTAYAMALLYLNGVPLALAVALTLLIGAAIGVVNGLITVKMAHSLIHHDSRQHDGGAGIRTLDLGRPLGFVSSH